MFLDVQNGLWTNYNIAIASSASKRKNKRTIVAVLSALKNRGKKKAVAKKSAATKKPVKRYLITLKVTLLTLPMGVNK